MNPAEHSPLEEPRRKDNPMELLVLVAVLAAWFVLQAWILPRFGVST